jgi:hypothetical protein
MKRFTRWSLGRVLRPAFEWILLIGSLVAGLGVLGSCAFSGSSAPDAGVLAGLVFAIVLVGAVYLLTTMSRDLRRLREHYVDNAAGEAPRAEIAVSEESLGADT